MRVFQQYALSNFLLLLLERGTEAIALDYMYCCFYNTYKFHNACHKSEFRSVNVIF